MTAKIATLYRMVMPDHLCPSGLKAKWLLESKGYTVDDHHLTTRAETDAFKAEHDVKTTPQAWIGGQRIGGYTDLRAHFGEAVDKGGTSYKPVIALFAMTAGSGSRRNSSSMSRSRLARVVASSLSA